MLFPGRENKLGLPDSMDRAISEKRGKCYANLDCELPRAAACRESLRLEIIGGLLDFRVPNETAQTHSRKCNKIHGNRNSKLGGRTVDSI